VISAGALTPVLVCFHKLEITPLSNFPPRDGTAFCKVNQLVNAPITALSLARITA
jgi:hypothetical protein